MGAPWIRVYLSLCVHVHMHRCAYVEVRGQPCMLFLNCYHFGGWGWVSQCLGTHQLGQAG